jgi:hypothetical protein
MADSAENTRALAHLQAKAAARTRKEATADGLGAPIMTRDRVKRAYASSRCLPCRTSPSTTKTIQAQLPPHALRILPSMPSLYLLYLAATSSGGENAHVVHVFLF